MMYDILHCKFSFIREKGTVKLSTRGMPPNLWKRVQLSYLPEVCLLICVCCYYRCAGVCCYEGRGGLCSVRLSVPLLKLRPRKDLIETLLVWLSVLCILVIFFYFFLVELIILNGCDILRTSFLILKFLLFLQHEMIHAYLFVTANNRDRDGHGPEFHKHMYRINDMAGTRITVSMQKFCFLRKIHSQFSLIHILHATSDRVVHTFHNPLLIETYLYYKTDFSRFSIVSMMRWMFIGSIFGSVMGHAVQGGLTLVQ